MKHTHALLMLLISLVMVFAVACNSYSGSDMTQESTQTTPITQTTAPTDTTKEPAYFNVTGYPICDDPITLTVSGAFSPNNTPDWNSTIMVEQIKERLGIILDCNPISVGDAWNTQLTLMLSSDELPDIILLSGLTASAVADYGSQGYFLVMNDLIEQYAPNLQTYMDKYDMLRTYMTSADGNIYMTVKINDNSITQVPRMFLNKTWLAKVNMEEPSTIDEFYNVLAAFKEQDANGNGNSNDEIPLSYFVDGNVDSALMTAFGINSRSISYIPQVDDDGTVFISNTTDNYKAYLTFLHKLYVEGLLDAEVFIQTKDAFNAKVGEDLVGCFGTPGAPYVSAGKGIDYDSNFIWSGAYTSEWNETPTVVSTQKVAPTPVVIASSKTQYPEAIIRLIDYYYTEEGMNSASFGYEGLSFDWVEKTYDGQSFKDLKTYIPEGYSSWEEFRINKVVINGGFYHVQVTQSYNPLLEMKYESLLSDEVMARWGWAALIAHNSIRNPDVKIVTTFPALIYTNEENDARSTLVTDITTYLESAKTQFVTGEVGIEEGWSSYLSTLEKMGLSDLLELEQGAYNRLIGN